MTRLLHLVPLQRIEIERCSDCPMHIYQVPWHRCIMNSKRGRILAITGDGYKRELETIPNWCPLPKKESEASDV